MSDSYTGLTTPALLSPTKSTSSSGWSSPGTPSSPLSCCPSHAGEADILSSTFPILPANSAPRLRTCVHKCECMNSSTSHSCCASKTSDKEFGAISLPASAPIKPLRNPSRTVSLAPGACKTSPSLFQKLSVASGHLHPLPAPSHPGDAHQSPSSSPISIPSLDGTNLDALSTATDCDPPFGPVLLQPPCAGSPLRSSGLLQKRGFSLLSPPRRLCQTADRFIPHRRSPAISRECFELPLRRPAERLTTRRRYLGSAGADPFSPRLHRSERMDEELRGLREAHSVITTRVNMTRRGPNFGIRRGYSHGVRQISAGAIWNVGGSAAPSQAVDTVIGVPNGRGGILGSGTNAPLYKSMFLSQSDPAAELEAYESRLALAFDVSQTKRLLEHNRPTRKPKSAASRTPATSLHNVVNHGHVWKDNEWISAQGFQANHQEAILDAPQLRDDYYCSPLAYSPTSKCLAVGLGNFVHLWSERKGVDTPQSLNAMVRSDVQHVTSLAFSSAQGRQAILAVGRADGRLSLWSTFDSDVRFSADQPKPISCASFRPTVARRASLRDNAMIVPTEELLIRDEVGHIYFYSVEWPSETDSALFGWQGALTLMVRMAMHSQQICGLSWSMDGEYFASGGNDNACYLFETKKILQKYRDPSLSNLNVRQGPAGETIWTVTPGHANIPIVEPGHEKHKWELNAAVKAIAFCPWQRGLVAIGGGSNDRCIHFYHTISGACLATIDCAAQITSLIWSSRRREIAATFGFAQPEHPFRIAVFAWPSCEQIVAIPWYDENRALFAIPYPGGSATGRERGEDGVWWSRSAEEGCLVVAASDAAIRFHEIWIEDRRNQRDSGGLLGGSNILESLHGIERHRDQVIR